MPDSSIQNKSPGEVLLEAPISDIVEKLCLAIAKAQLRLDRNSIETGFLLGNTKFDYEDSEGNTQSRSLLELGFGPTFYHFERAAIKVKMSISMKVQEYVGIGLDLAVGDSIQNPTRPTPPAETPGEGGDGEGDVDDTERRGPRVSARTVSPQDTETPTTPPAEEKKKEAVAFGASVSLEYSRKFNYDVKGSSVMNVIMISVPAPPGFISALKDATTPPPEEPEGEAPGGEEPGGG